MPKVRFFRRFWERYWVAVEEWNGATPLRITIVAFLAIFSVITTVFALDEENNTRMILDLVQSLANVVLAIAFALPSRWKIQAFTLFLLGSILLLVSVIYTLYS